jgi:hypothetical protein
MYLVLIRTYMYLHYVRRDGEGVEEIPYCVRPRYPRGAAIYIVKRKKIYTYIKMFESTTNSLFLITPRDFNSPKKFGNTRSLCPRTTLAFDFCVNSSPQVSVTFF